MCGFMWKSAMWFVQVAVEARRQCQAESMELELQAVVNWSMWALGTELGSSESAVDALNHQAISPASVFLSLFSRRGTWFILLSLFLLI